jgi:hypothetical protein
MSCSLRLAGSAGEKAAIWPTDRLDKDLCRANSHHTVRKVLRRLDPIPVVDFLEAGFEHLISRLFSLDFNADSSRKIDDNVDARSA